MSYEDLRDNYKSSRQSSDVKFKLNGGTCRKIRSSHIYKHMGNIITIQDNINGLENLSDVNAKYGLAETSVQYSLNKKNRWKIAEELKNKMDEFANDKFDVRLYEKSNRNEKKSNNVISMVNSKDHDLRVSVKKTYANFDSLMVEYELKKTRNNAGETCQTKKQLRQAAAITRSNHNSSSNINRNSKSSKKKPTLAQSHAENIVINLDEDDDNENDRYAQYEIEYAPNKDVLKYGVDIFNSKSNFNSTRKFKNYSENDEFEDNIEYSEEDQMAYDDSNDNFFDEPLKLSLDELINLHLVSIIDKQCMLNEIEAAKPNTKANEVTGKATNLMKDRKIFVQKEVTAVTVESNQSLFTIRY